MKHTTIPRKINIFIAIITSFIIIACGGSRESSRNTPSLPSPPPSQPSPPPSQPSPPPSPPLLQPPLTINVQTPKLSVLEEAGTIQYTLNLNSALDRRVVQLVMKRLVVQHSLEKILLLKQAQQQ